MPHKKVLLGSDYFPKLIAEDILYVDKTLLIKEIIEDKSDVILITRPRRWGKTLNMSMLQHFFAPRVLGTETRPLFNGLKIAREDGGKYMEYQGQYPVIFITLKDTVGSSLDDIKSKIYQAIGRLFGEHHNLVKENSSKIDVKSRSDFETIVNGTANPAQYEGALFTLSRCLNAIYGKKAYILIDEYDAPLNHAFGKEYFKIKENFDALVEFIRNFLGAGLKSNPHLEKGIITGVFRIAKANIFSGLNNTVECTLLEKNYTRYFGFTDEEIIELSNPSGEYSPYIKCNFAEVKEWYDGYNIGGVTIYNPWSIMSYIKNQEIKAYWIETGGGQLIEDVLRTSSAGIKQQFEQLMQGKTIEVTLDKFTTFDKLTVNQSAFWGMLFNAGYLTMCRFIGASPGKTCACEVRIPNKEVAVFYLQIIKSWLDNDEGIEQKESFITALIAGDIEKFKRNLKSFLISSFSSFDVGGENPERVYHAFMLGLMAHIRESYTIKSNRESGEGRYDVLLKPKDKTALAIIFEFKSIDSESSAKQLAKSAVKALEQIRAKGYENELDEEGIIQRLLIGVSFAGKRVEIRHERKITADFNPALHIETYKKSSSLLTGFTPPPPLLLSASQTATAFDPIRKMFGNVVGVEKTVTGIFEDHEISFDVYRTGGGGHCGFFSLPIPYDRGGVVSLLMKHSSNARIRALAMPEIIENLKTGHLLAILMDKHPEFMAFNAYQASVDRQQSTLLASVLDAIDHDRTQIPERSFENVMQYLVEKNTPQARELLTKMQAFQSEYEAKLNEFQTFCQNKKIFEDFIKEYIGKDGELSFTRGGLNFERQTSFLDAILAVAEPPVRLYIWEDVGGKPSKVHIVYNGGPKEAPTSHIYHVRGQDTHFALMAISMPSLELSCGLKAGEAPCVAVAQPSAMQVDKPFGKRDIRSFFAPSTSKRTERPGEHSAISSEENPAKKQRL